MSQNARVRKLKSRVLPTPCAAVSVDVPAPDGQSKLRCMDADIVVLTAILRARSPVSTACTHIPNRCCPKGRTSTHTLSFRSIYRSSLNAISSVPVTFTIRSFRILDNYTRHTCMVLDLYFTVCCLPLITHSPYVYHVITMNISFGASHEFLLRWQRRQSGAVGNFMQSY